MAWSLVYDSSSAQDFAVSHRPITAGSTLVNGWTDTQGAIWTTANGVLISNVPGIPTPAVNFNTLLRPSSEDAADARIVVDIPAGFSPGSQVVAAVLRSNRGSGTGATEYIGLISRTLTCEFNKLVNGVQTGLGITTFAYNAAHTYELDFNVIGTTFNLTVTDTTSSTVVSTIGPITDSAISGSGSYGLLSLINVIVTNNATRVRTYKNITSGIILSPNIGGTNGSYTVTATGVGGTAWTLATTFSLSGLAGASVVTNSIDTVGQTANLTITTGSTAGVATISDSTDAFTVPFTVNVPSFGINPDEALVGATTAATVYGAYTNWVSGTTFAKSGGTGSSLTTNSVNVGAQTASLSIVSGSTSGPLAITDSTDAATTNFNVMRPIPITDAGFAFSPCNWFKSGSSYALSNTAGAYFYFQFTGTDAILNLDTSALGANPLIVSVQVDNLPFVDTNIQALSNLTLLANGLNTLHTIMVYYKGRTTSVNAWTGPASAVKLTGIAINVGATTSAPRVRPKKMIVYGDSRVEGYGNIGALGTAAGQDAKATSAFIIAEGLNAELGLIAFAGQDFTIVGLSGVPGLYNPASPTVATWDKYYLATSRLSGGLYIEQPDYIFCLDMGSNGGALPPSTQQAAVQAWLPLVRAAAPNAIIFVGTGGYDGSQASAFVAAFNAYQAATPDPNCCLIPNTLSASEQSAMSSALNGLSTTFMCSQDGIHPNATYGQPRVGGRFLSSVQAILDKAKSAYAY